MTFAALDKRRIVVTGSSSGIGRAIALECAKAGASVVVHCRRSAAQAELVADEARRMGVQADVCCADIACHAGRNRLVDEVFRTGPVDAIVNNAGADLLTSELRNSDFEQKLDALLQTDLIATMQLSREFGRRFQQQQHGVILNLGWDQSDRGMEGDSGELFAAVKNAVMGFSRSLAVSLAPYVRVNCIAPGWIRTAWGELASEYWQQRVVAETPLRRWGKPEDVAAMARFLLSDDAAYITGQVINVNGGAVR